MFSPSRIKREFFSSDEENDVEEDEHEQCDQKDGRTELLEFERNIMLDTFSDDTLFVVARGLGLERLILHHMHLYSDEKLLVFVINTTQQDEAFFLSRLRSNKCPPKIITSEILSKDRESLYMEGGVQFITSRILMVDLLQDRVPVKNVAGVIVHRAHQLLTSYQESFILRLYREKKANGFVKAFTDNPGMLNSIGVLQRLVNQLYIRRVRLLPRFDVDVKRILDLYSPTLIEMSCDLPLPMRRIQSALADIIRTCLKELKQSATSDVASEDDPISVSAGLTATSLEIRLKTKHSLLTEKQQRLLADLQNLRSLLFEAEELDPTVVFKSLATIRADKEKVASNSGWLFTQTASKLFAEAENICKLKKKDDYTILEPPKWSALKSVLDEIRLVAESKRSQNMKASPVFLIASSNEVCMHLRDLIKWGPNLLKWIKFRNIMSELSIISNESEPDAEPLWDLSQLVMFASNLEGENRNEIVMSVRNLQKQSTRQGKKRRKVAEAELARRRKLAEEFKPGEKKHKSAEAETKENQTATDNQTKLVQFGIVHYKKSKQCGFFIANQ